jgi:chemosensory pili system protein ChpA (sensor histidine kinase/response regulator)
MSSNSVESEEIESSAADLGPLAWVLDELRKSLDGATKALRRFVRDAELARGSDLSELDASHLRIARQQLHQAVGALEMVGLEAPAKVLRAMESLAQRFVQRPELCSEDAATKVERASFALTEYLEGMIKGKKASAVALFPQYRDVMELTGGERAHPADLWPVEWDWMEVILPVTVEALSNASSLREQMDAGVLRVMKTADTAAAKRLGQLCVGIAAGHPAQDTRAFWSICAAYFEAVSLGLCAADLYAKRAAARVLRQYAALAKGDSSVSTQLARDLLFFCALAEPAAGQDAPALNAVRLAYGLSFDKKVDYSEEKFGLFDPALMALARKRIATAAETWSGLAGGDINRLKTVTEQFSAVSESIVKLHPESGELAHALTSAIDMTVRSGNVPDPAVAMEVATAVLYLEAAYEDLDPTNSKMEERGASLAQRLTHVAAGGQPEPLEAWMEELYRRVADRQTMGSVVDELRTTLGQVEASLDLFFRTPQDKAPLRDIPSQLAQMRGVFSVLGLDQAALASLRMRSCVEQMLIDEIDVESARVGIFDKLGNSVGVMGFLIDMLSYQRSLAKKLFVYDEELGEFKSLMGREREVTPAPTETPMVAPALDPVVAMESAVVEPSPVVAAPVLTQIAAPVQSAVAVDDDADDDSELLDIFLEEAREVSEAGMVAVKALAVAPNDLSEQTTLRRAFHTLKGSSRMVGLDEFGEAAWSFEQLLNARLADQMPADEDLISLVASAMESFGRWIADIAAGNADGWKAQAFRDASDALRLNHQLIPLNPTGSELPTELSHEAPFVGLEAAPDLNAEVQLNDVDVVPSAEVMPVVGTPTIDVDPFVFVEPVAEPALDINADPEPEQRPPQFASTQTFGFDDMQAFEASEARKVDEAKDLNFGNFDFGAPTPSLVEPATESPALTHGAVEDALSVVNDAIDLPDFEHSKASFLAPVVDATVAEPVLMDADTIEPSINAEPISAVLPELGSDDAAHATPDAPDDAVETDDQTKVIGNLRLSIPLYNVYLNEADEWSRRLQIELSEWALELQCPLPDSLVNLAHSLLGSSATVGFSALSEMSRSLEQALQHVQLHHQGSSEQAQVFTNAAEDIRRLLHQFAAGFLKEPDAAVLAALQAIIDTQFPAPTIESMAEDQNEETTDAGGLSEQHDGLTVTPEFGQDTQPPMESADEIDAVALRSQDLAASMDGDIDSVAPDAPVDAEMPPAPLLVQAAGTQLVGAAPLTIADAQDEEIDAVDALDEDLFPIFQEEAEELMPKLGSALREWVEAPDRRDARNEVLRVLHTLKGSARLAGAMRLGEMAHHMESNIEQIGSESLQSIQLEPLLTRFDTLQEVFTRLGAPPEAVETPTHSAQPQHGQQDVKAGVPAFTNVVQLQTMPRGAILAAPRPVANQSVRVRSQLLDRLVNQAGEVMISRARIDSRLTQLRASLGELGGNLERLRHQLRDVELQSESQMQSRLAQTKDSAQAFDPLEFDRFTRVQELTRMMAESVHDVATVQRSLQRSVEGAEDDLIAQGRQARELQRDLLRTRMMEFEGVSDRLYAVVRQAAKDAGKQVKLDIVGGSIEMDRGVMERMAPAFEHMLRNAVAHGIESTADRISAEKPASGTITIKVDQESNDISVSFIDDGGGLHLDKIRARAIANGVIQESDVLSEGDAANLIFTPGFSTAEQVTELAGRGIGMDVVRSEVNALGGRIETSTVPGQGTTFKLIMPLTTAVTQVVMLRMGDFTIAVPSNLVETVLRTPASVLEEAYQRDGFEVAGQMLPFFWSGALLQVSSQSHEAQTKHFSVVVLRSAGQRLAMHVDEILGNREVVVKNLGPQLSRLPGLAGVSVLASGAVALIYNPVALASVYGEQARQLRQAALAAGATADAGGQAAQGLVGAANQVPLILVVDDSITVRRVTQRLLKREGYRVALASDGLQALERLQEEKPTLVLSDIEMPRMDGFDLARNIRGDDNLKDLPIIMITSRIAGKHREHAKELGVDHYLGKPYSEDELLGLVRSYCDKVVTA